MTITQIGSRWWKLVVEADDQPTLTFYGYARSQVIGKYFSYLRNQMVRNIRTYPQ